MLNMVTFGPHGFMVSAGTTTVDICTPMFRPTINYSSWYLKYRGLDEGTIFSDANM